MESETFHKFAQVASSTGADDVEFSDCNLTSEKLNAFAQGAIKLGLKINQFFLSDKTMESKTFHKFAQVASTTGSNTVKICNCNLTSEKINAFAQGATDSGLKINTLSLIDGTVEFEAFHIFAQVASTVETSEVQFIESNLTNEKLKAFAQGATDFNLKIDRFALSDKTMKSEAFHKFAQVASTTGANIMQFSNCNLTSEKLNAFAQGATDFGLKINCLFEDNTMECEAFHKVAEVASTTKSDILLFCNCNLTSEKLNAFRTGAIHCDLKINHLHLQNEAIDTEAFHEFSQVASTTKAKTVYFTDCSLTSENLNAFAQGATDIGLTIKQFVVSDKTMESEAFHKFAEVASTIGANMVQFGDCNLTSKKLNALAQGVTDFGLKINTLSLVDKTMEFEAFHIFAQVASTVETSKVQFSGCNLTNVKLNAFAQGATESSLKATPVRRLN
uniref:uncharacterized protein LOC120336001 n=1 Tax=Styela clava TaxID=7725 RepID=UPI00193A61B0|nr:uncharacterized protein LOC120336001 [Styela clava]